jgi:hypothetical protein
MFIFKYECIYVRMYIYIYLKSLSKLKDTALKKIKAQRLSSVFFFKHMFCNFYL